MNKPTRTLTAALMILLIISGAASASPFDSIDSYISNTLNNLKGSIPQLSLLGGSSGFTVNSISSTKIISNDLDIQNANFIVTATANGGGQSIIGSFDSNAFKSFSGYQTTHPLQISISGITETLQYPVRNNGAIYEYSYDFVDRPSYYTGATCTQDGRSDWVYCFQADMNSYGGFGANRYMRVFKTEVGNYGGFDNPTITWNGQITETINSISDTKPIGSADSQYGSSVMFSSGDTAKWTGSLVSGTATPNQNLYTAVYSGSKWKAASASYFNDPNTGYSTTTAAAKAKMDTLSSLSGQGCLDKDCGAIVPLLTAQIQATETLISDDRQITYTSATGDTTHTSTGGTSNGMITESSSRVIGYPQFVLTIKASELGVLIPIGKPTIINIDAPTFASGDNNGVATVHFTNTGTGSGTFAASFTEPTGTFSTTGTTGMVTVSPGGLGSISIYIGHGSTAQEISKTATIKVYDYNKPSNHAEKSFTVSMTAPKACIAGTTRTDGNIAYKCKADGSGEEIIVNCNTGGQYLLYDGANYICKQAQSGTTPNPLSTPGTPGTQQGADYTWIFWIAVSGVALYIFKEYIPYLQTRPILIIPAAVALGYFIWQFDTIIHWGEVVIISMALAFIVVLLLSIFTPIGFFLRSPISMIVATVLIGLLFVEIYSFLTGIYDALPWWLK